MRSAPSVAVVLGTALLLAGCSSAPSRDDVAERYAIEMSGSIGGEVSDWIDVGDSMADSALKGMCGNDAFRSTAFVGQPSALYAWDATCLMYFERDMTASQVDRAKASVVDHVSAG